MSKNMAEIYALRSRIERQDKLIDSLRKTIGQERRWRHQAETELENLKKDRDR